MMHEPAPHVRHPLAARSRRSSLRVACATARARGAVVALIGAGALGALVACGGQPNCEPHPCPSWSRLDPYTCTCVDPDAQASQAHRVSRAPVGGADAGAGDPR